MISERQAPPLHVIPAFPLREGFGGHVAGMTILVFLVLTLSACGGPPVKIGTTVKGTRIALLEKNKTVEPDTDLHDQKPQLPDSVSNKAWAQAGFDPTHVLPNAAVGDHPKKIWSESLGAGSSSEFKLLARPVVSEGRIFAMDAKGSVTAFEAKTGEKLWEFDTTPEDRDEKAMGGGLGVEGDTVYATTGFGEVLALNVTNGAVKWRHLLMNPLRAAPTIVDGRVYVVSIDNELQTLDAKNGEVLWHHNGIAESATLMGASSPAVVGDSVVVAYSSGEIFNLRAQNGRVSWTYALTSPTQVGALPAIADIRGLPVLDHGRVIAISHNGRMAAIDQRTGDRAWELEVGGVNSPLVAGDTIFILSNDDQLIALTRETGRIMWVHEMPTKADPKEDDSDKLSWTGPVLAGGRLWMSNSLGKLASFSPDKGDPLESLDLGTSITLPPVVADQIIYVVTDDGKLVALQ